MNSSHALLGFGLLSLAAPAAAGPQGPESAASEPLLPADNPDEECLTLDTAFALRDAQITRLQADISFSAPLVPLCLPDFTYTPRRLLEIDELSPEPIPGASPPVPPPPLPPGGGGEVGG